MRGTPASGKSILARLLFLYYRAQDVPAILIKSWPRSGHGAYAPVVVQEAKDAGYSFITHDNLDDANIVILLDEAQMTYSNDSLWLGLIKMQSNAQSGPRIALFSSYGSPSGGPTETTAGSPLAFLDIRKRVSITPSPLPHAPQVSLFYSRDEFDDVVSRHCQDQRFFLELNEDARDYIFNLTNGHPGSVDCVIVVLQEVCSWDSNSSACTRSNISNLDQMFHSELKSGKIINSTEVEAIFDRKSEAFGYLLYSPAFRSFPSRRCQRLSSLAVRALRRALAEGNIPRDLSDEGIRICYEEGWLHSEALDHEATEVVCFLPTKLHAKLAQFCSCSPIWNPPSLIQETGM